tara:strand:+ start:1183 stop:1635 length:453 start_codon:yes stop_codon:yes gene_type:complete
MLSTENSVKETTHTVKTISLYLLITSIFFSLLFFVYNSSEYPSGSQDTRDILYTYILVITTLTITMIITEIYHSRKRSARVLKYLAITVNVIVISLSINELLNGPASLFGAANDAEDAVNHTYSSLAVGFAGAGTLLSLIHNFYGITHDL